MSLLDAFRTGSQRPESGPCPRCGSKDVRGIIYGLVDWKTPIDKSRYVLGGCTVSPENTNCKACGYSWKVPDAAARPSFRVGRFRSLLWGALGGAAFSACVIGFPVGMLIFFHDWSPPLSHAWLNILFYVPGLVAGIAAWIAVYRYSQKRLR